MSNIYCFIPCRSESTRFPKKHLELINGKSVLRHVYDRCKSVLYNVIILIPEGDTYYKEYLQKEMIPFFEGDKDNVLKRFYDAAKFYDADRIIRITGDCPVLNTDNLYYMIDWCEPFGLDFFSNCFPPRTIIDGDDIEIMSFKFLEFLYKSATKKEHQEHVTKLIYDLYGHQEIYDFLGFKIKSIRNYINLSHIKTSIDTMEDLEFVKKVIV